VITENVISRCDKCGQPAEDIVGYDRWQVCYACADAYEAGRAEDRRQEERRRKIAACYRCQEDCSRDNSRDCETCEFN
jgi:hypothetical protein